MEQLERLFDLSLDMLCVAGFDGHFKHVNPAFTRVLGYRAEELLRRRFIEFVHPDDRQPTLDAMAELIEGRPVIDFENRYFCKDGSVRWLAWRSRSVPEDGAVYAVARDVTEARRLTQLKEAAEILRSVAEGTARATGTAYFRALVRSLAQALGVRYCFVAECSESAPGPARTLAFWDGEDFSDNMEYPIVDTPCQRVFDGETCLYGEHVRELFPRDADLVKLGAESYVAVPMVSSAGQVIGILAALDVEPFQSEGLDTSVLSIFAGRAGAELERQRAELENRKIQAQMLHSQKLESLGVLAGGIAHDFNNILVGVLGNSGLALRELTPGSPAQPFLERIEEAAQRAADLANQMLAYSGKGQFVIETLNLKELVEGMEDLVRTSISKKASLRFRFGEHIPPIRADATQIRQVVMNLVTNASDALGEASGSLSVDIDTLEADGAYLAETYPGDELPAGRYVCLKVSDTGCGMDEATRAKIFDPFFTTKLTGRGLGMAAVLGIVRGHRGTIRVESTPGYGSTFTVLLPSSGEADGTAPKLPTREVGETKPQTGKILVVDDEEIVREVARLSLVSSGYEVLTAVDGHEALETFLREGDEIAAVVLDLTMPNMSGKETFHELRRLRPDVRVILTSGYNEHDAASRFEDERPAGFLKKPFRAVDLVQKVNQVLGQASLG